MGNFARGRTTLSLSGPYGAVLVLDNARGAVLMGRPRWTAATFLGLAFFVDSEIVEVFRFIVVCGIEMCA